MSFQGNKISNSIGRTIDYTELDIITCVMLSVKIRSFVSEYRYIESIAEI